jgi:F0F1-type ATP synthase membrane subunit b/b'
MEAHLIYLITFISFLVCGHKFLWPHLRNLIDTYIQEIHQKIEGASRYREDALSFLNSCKRKSQEASLKAAKILENAHLEARQLEADTHKDLTLFESQQKELATEKSHKLERAIAQRVRDRIREETLKRVRERLTPS